MSAKPPAYRKGETVVHAATQRTGGVEADPILDGGEYLYRVRFCNSVERIVEEDLQPLAGTDETVADLALQGRWGQLQAFRTALTLARIKNDNRSTVFSFKSQRILFEPYQYKPLLKILDSSDRRLLIADEVGLGKTIEAGLILTELQARKPLDRMLIVCPSRLRDKWREELNRKFDQDFQIYSKKDLEQYVQEARQNPRLARLRAIASMQTLRDADLRDLIAAEVGQFDLVIVDEAHHARNSGTQTSRMLTDLGEMSECLLLLSATPIQLGNRDLFTLLQALRPTEFRDLTVFDRQLRDHAGVHEAARLVRSPNPQAIDEVVRILHSIFVEKVPTHLRNPLAIQLLSDLESDPPQDRRDRLEVERRIQELHPLGTIVTRTRKRDVQERAPVRRANVYTCRWTAEEDQLYQRLVGGGSPRGWFREKLQLGQIQRARQAASSLPAAARSHEKPFIASDDEATEWSDIPPSDSGGGREIMPLTWGPVDGSRLSVDSKYNKLRELLNGIWAQEPSAKVLIFTFFVGTATYLHDRLMAEGIRSLRIAGDVTSDPQHPERDERGRRIRDFRRDRSIRVLVSTEVGSEGLDFQFAHHLVNYDLPWNPMVVEQRIGRIDRFGQEADVVCIHNLVVQGTVEEKILERLYRRIGIFEQSLGDLETILGDKVNELQYDYLNGRLTPEDADRRLEETACAILNRKREQATLENAAAALFGHEQYIRDEMERVGRLGRYITGRSILALLRTFFQAQHPGVRLWQEEDDSYALRLTPELRTAIRRASLGGSVWVDRSEDDELALTFQGETAFRRPELELVNRDHPLVRAAEIALQDLFRSAGSRVGRAVLELGPGRDGDLAAGIYYVAVYVQNVTSIRDRRILEPVAWSQAENRILDADLSERLLHLVLDEAEECPTSDVLPPLPLEAWTLIEGEALARNRKLRDSERRENEAIYTRRLAALQQEHENDVRLKQQRLETNRQRGHERVLPALLGQLQRAEANYESKREELMRTRSPSVSLSEPVAICGVILKRTR
jgi:SNF2 family DNA or RNA helicase